MESHLSPFQGKSLTMKLHSFAPVDIFSLVSVRQLYADWHLGEICLGWMALSQAIRSWILLSLYRFRRRVLIREEKWHLLTLLLYLRGYLPQRSPFKQSPNAVFVSVVRCYEISVWSSMSDRESLAWGKRFNIMWTFVLFTSATFISVCELLSCFFPTAKFKTFTFALLHIPLEPQIRCKMGMLIISSPRQQRSCKQHSCFFQVIFF